MGGFNAKNALKFILVLLVSLVYMFAVGLLFNNYVSLYEKVHDYEDRLLSANSTFSENSIMLQSEDAFSVDEQTAIMAELTAQFGSEIISSTFAKIEGENNIILASELFDNKYLTLTEGVMPDLSATTASYCEVLANGVSYYGVGSKYTIEVSYILDGKTTRTEITCKVVGVVGDSLVPYSVTGFLMPDMEEQLGTSLTSATADSMYITFADSQTATVALQFISENSQLGTATSIMTYEEVFTQNIAVYSDEADAILPLAIITTIIISVAFLALMAWLIKKLDTSLIGLSIGILVGATIPTLVYAYLPIYLGLIVVAVVATIGYIVKEKRGEK